MIARTQTGFVFPVSVATMRKEVSCAADAQYVVADKMIKAKLPKKTRLICTFYTQEPSGPRDSSAMVVVTLGFGIRTQTKSLSVDSSVTCRISPRTVTWLKVSRALL